MGSSLIGREEDGIVSNHFFHLDEVDKGSRMEGKVGASAGKSDEGGMKLGVVYRVSVVWRPL